MARAKKPEERKKEIILTAKKMFSEKGYKATQVKDIVAEIGVAQGLFYYYFKSKEEVMEAVAENYAASIISEIENNLATGVSFIEKCNNIFSAFIRNADESGKLFEGIQIAENGIIHQRIMHVVARELIPLIVQLVEETNATDDISCKYPEQSVELLINGIFSTLDKIPFEDKISYVKNNMEVWMEITKKIFGVSEEGIHESQ